MLLDNEQGLVVTVSWTLRKCHTESIIRHCWSLDQILLRKKYRETGCHSLSLVGFRLFGVPTYTPSLFDADEVWLLHQKPARQAHHRFVCCPTLRSPSEPHHPGPVSATIALTSKEQILLSELLETIPSLTVLFPKACYIRRLDAAVHNPALKS